MVNPTERTLGHALGLVGGFLILAGGLVALAFGVADLVMGHLGAGAGAIGETIVLFVVGALVLLFAHLGVHGWQDRPLASGVLLVVLAVVGWLALGLGANVVALVGGILALVAGVLYLIEPTQHAAARLVSVG
ncbi:MAG: hypothetical protein ACRECT_03650 [Thermoplasmata archaeon]